MYSNAECVRITSHNSKVTMILTVASIIAIGFLMLTISSDDSYSDLQSTIHDGVEYNIAFDGSAQVTGYHGDGGVVTIRDKVTIDGVNYTVKRIEDRSFHYCDTITEIILPETMMVIGQYAFEGCSSIVTVHIPASVSVVDNYAFSHCYSLLRFTVSSENEMYTADEAGALVDKVLSKLVCYPAGRTDPTYRTPDNVRTIASHAFWDCTSLKYVEFSDSVETIEDKAFRGCYNLIAIELGSSVSKIGYAFEDSRSLVEIYNRSSIPLYPHCNGHGNVGKYVRHVYSEEGDSGIYDQGDYVLLVTDGVCYIVKYFGEGGQLVLPDAMIADGHTYQTYSIMQYVFTGCDTLTSVEIPAAVTSIEAPTFNNCKNLTRITVSSGNPEYCSDSAGALYDKDMTILIAYPMASVADEYTVPGTVKRIAPNAFEGNRFLKAVNFHNDDLFIDEYAFRGSVSLESIELPNNRSPVGVYAFYECTSLKKVTVGHRTEHISEYSFHLCKSIELIVNNSLISITKGSSGNGYLGLYAKEIMGNIKELKTDSMGLRYNDLSKACSMFGYYGNEKTLDLTEILIDGVSYKLLIIENGVFGSVPIETLILGDSLVYIDEYAFHDNKTLKSLTLGNGIEQIKSNAFRGCSSLVSVDFGNSIKRIEGESFLSCSALAHVDLPDSLTHIGDHAFYRCTGLQTVKIGAGVTYVGIGAFKYADSLKSITVSKDNKSYSSDDYGVLFNKDMTALILFPRSSNVLMYEAPNGLTKVNEGAFEFCSKVESLTFPDTLKKVEYRAFADATSLRYVNFGNGLDTIGVLAFIGCTSLTRVNLGDSLRQVGDSAFEGCTSLEALDFPDSVTFLGEKVAFNCTSLTHLHIGDGLLKVPKKGFQGCTSLSVLELGSKLEVIDEWAFVECTSLKSFILPDSLKTIGLAAFWFCRTIEEVVIGDNVTYIQEGAFSSCTSLKSVTLPKVNDLKIGAGAFDCTAITSIDLGDNIKSLGIGVFRNCWALVEVKLPVNIYTIPEDSFDGCVSLTTVEFTGYIAVILQNAFRGCTSLKNIVLPPMIEEIRYNAFTNCTSLTTITLPSSLYHIGHDAFRGCIHLAEVCNYSALNVTAGSDDLGCVALYATHVHKGNSTQFVQGDFIYMTNGNRTSVVRYLGKETQVSIPYEVTVGSKVRSVTHIHNNLFHGNESITSVTLPAYVESIGKYAFKGCISLTSVNALLDAMYLTEIQEGAFEGCSSLSFSLPVSVKKIGANAFKDCRSLITISLSPSLQSIGMDAFRGCTSLSEVRNFSKLNVVAGTEDHGCVALYAIEVHKRDLTSQFVVDDFLFMLSHDRVHVLRYIGDAADVTVPLYVSYNGTSYQVCHINYDAFRGVKSLKSITVPHIIESIREYAFDGCVSLESVTILGAETSISSHSFDGCDNVKHLTLPINFNAVGKNSDPIFGQFKCLESITLFGHNVAGFDYVTDDASEGTDCYTRTPWHMSAGSLKKIVVSDGVTHIGSNTFNGCSSVNMVIIGNDVASIGQDAFLDCSSVLRLVLPISLDTIVDEDRPALGSMTVIESLEFTAGTGAGPDFDDGSASVEGMDYTKTPWYLSRGSLRDIVFLNGIVSIGTNAFRDCGSLSTVTLGKDIVSIGTNAFLGCTELKYVANPSDLSLSQYTYDHGCVALYAEHLWGGDVLEQDGMRYLYRTGAKTAILLSAPIDVTDIHLTYVRIEGIGYPIVDVFPGALVGCDNIRSFTFGPGFKTIPSGLFYNPAALETLVISDSVESISPGAFSGCINLREITMPISLNAVSKLKDPAFAGCTNIRKVTFTPGTGHGVDYAADDSKYDYRCTPWYLSRDSLEEIVLNEGILSIGNMAFRDLKKLSTIRLPASLESIGAETFLGCVSLTSFSVDEESEHFKAIGGVLFSKDGRELVLYPAGIPDYIYRIPDHVVTIAPMAFMDCPSLTVFTVGSGNAHFSVDDSGVLFDKEKRLLIKYPDGKGLSSYTMPESVTHIGPHAFTGHTSLVSIVMPISVAAFGDGTHPAFFGCSIREFTFTKGSGDGTDFTDVAGPQSHTTTPWFINRETVESIVFSDGIRTIGTFMFKDLSKVKSLNFPNSMRVIGEGAFANCTGLQEITFGAMLVFVNHGAFDGISFYDYDGVTPLEPLADVLCGSGFSGTSSKMVKVSQLEERKVTYRLDGVDLYDDTYYEGATVTIRDKVDMVGHTVTDWYSKDVVVVGRTFVLGDSDVLFVAESTPIQYTITFDTDGGSAIEPMKVDYGAVIVPPEGPTKTGYTFVGWDASLPETMPAHDIRVKALWSINEYTITFDTAGGSEIEPMTLYYGSEIVVPEDPTRVGFDFNGWSIAIPATMPAEDFTTIAQWTIIQLWATYMVGDEIYEKILLDYGSEVVVPSGDFVWPSVDGYRFVFMGWIGYVEGMVILEDLTFHARCLFEPETYPEIVDNSVTFGSNGEDSMYFNMGYLEETLRLFDTGEIDSLVFQLANGSIALDKDSVFALTSESITVSLLSHDERDLPPFIADFVGDFPVYGVSIGDNHQFDSGKVTIRIVTDVPDNAILESIRVLHFDHTGGSAFEIADFVYDAEKGVFDIFTNSLSYFAIIYDTVPEPAPSSDGDGDEDVAIGAIIAVIAIVAVVAYAVVRRF